MDQAHRQLPERSFPYRWALPAAVLLLAAVFRLSNLDYVEFKNDEAYNLLLALEWIDGGTLPLVGDASSIGTHNPPLFVWLLALPLLVTRDPALVTGCIALCNVLAAGVLWRFGCRWFGTAAGTVAALWLAVNPWAVFYARKIWMPDVLACFTLALFYLLYRVAVDGARRLAPAVLLLLAAVMLLYPPTVFFTPVVAAGFLLAVPRPRWRDLLAGALLAGLLALPYVWHDWQHDWSNLRQYRRAAALPVQVQPAALRLPLLMTTTFEFWPGRAAYGTAQAALDGAVLLVVAAGLLHLVRRWRDRRAALLLLWLLVPMLFLLLHRAPLQRRYFIALLPAAGLVFGIGCAAVAARYGGGRRWLLPLLVTLLLLPQAWRSARFITTGITVPHLAWLDYGPPLAYRLAEVRALAAGDVVTAGRVHGEIIARHRGERKYDVYATRYLLEQVVWRENR